MASAAVEGPIAESGSPRAVGGTGLREKPQGPSEMRRAAERIRIGTAAALVMAVLPVRALPLAASGPVAGLYERLALARLVIHGRCVEVDKRAVIEVVQVLKGQYDGPSLQVAYRSDNYNRTAGSPRIDFEPGSESIFILKPETDWKDQAKGEGRFQVAGGVAGKIDLPAEGAPALLDAARRLIAIQAIRNQDEVWAAQKALLGEKNPHLVAAGFEEVLKFRLGDESLVPDLLRHLDGQRPEFRQQAARVITQVFDECRRTGKEPASLDLLVRETLAHATADDSAETRTEAVRALRKLRRASLAEALRRIASHDPSQTVRYEAEVALLELREEE